MSTQNHDLNSSKHLFLGSLLGVSLLSLVTLNGNSDGVLQSVSKLTL